MSRQQNYVPIDAAVTSKCQSVFGDLPSIIQCKFDIEFPKIGYKNILPNNIYLTILLLNYTNNRQKHTTFFPDADNVGEGDRG